MKINVGDIFVAIFTLIFGLVFVITLIKISIPPGLGVNGVRDIIFSNCIQRDQVTRLKIYQTSFDKSVMSEAVLKFNSIRNAEISRRENIERFFTLLDSHKTPYGQFQNEGRERYFVYVFSGKKGGRFELSHSTSNIGAVNCYGNLSYLENYDQFILDVFALTDFSNE